MAKKKLGQGAIGTGAGTLAYTVPAGYRGLVRDINVTNTTSGALTFRIHLAPSGVSVGTSNALFYDSSIAGNGVCQWTGEQVLNADDFIQAIGSASGLSMNISGEEEKIN
jgi:hypothetical protein